MEEFRAQTFRRTPPFPNGSWNLGEFIKLLGSMRGTGELSNILIARVGKLNRISHFGSSIQEGVAIFWPQKGDHPDEMLIVTPHETTRKKVGTLQPWEDYKFPEVVPVSGVTKEILSLDLLTQVSLYDAILDGLSDINHGDASYAVVQALMATAPMRRATEEYKIAVAERLAQKKLKRGEKNKEIEKLREELLTLEEAIHTDICVLSIFNPTQ